MRCRSRFDLWIPLGRYRRSVFRGDSPSRRGGSRTQRVRAPCSSLPRMTWMWYRMSHRSNLRPYTPCMPNLGGHLSKIFRNWMSLPNFGCKACFLTRVAMGTPTHLWYRWFLSVILSPYLNGSYLENGRYNLFLTVAYPILYRFGYSKPPPECFENSIFANDRIRTRAARFARMQPGANFDTQRTVRPVL